MNISNLTRMIPISAAYILMLSTLYLLGFWSNFGINIFEFITLNEIISLALYQLSGYIGFVAFGVIVGNIFLSPAFPPGEGRDYPEAKFFRKHWRWFSIIPVLFFSYCAWFSEHPARWAAFALLLAPIVGSLLANTGILSDLIKNGQYRFPLLYAIGVLPCLTFVWGTVDAHIKRNPDEARYISIENHLEDPGIYIGRAGDYFFVFDTGSERLQAYRSSEVKEFTLSGNRQSKPVDKAPGKGSE